MTDDIITDWRGTPIAVGATVVWTSGGSYPSNHEGVVLGWKPNNATRRSLRPELHFTVKVKPNLAYEHRWATTRPRHVSASVVTVVAP